MANNPFDRVVINQLERPLSSDVDLESSEIDQEVRALLDAQTLGKGGNYGPRYVGFYGDSFQVVADGATNILKLTAGTGFQDAPGDIAIAIGGVPGLNDVQRLKPLILQPTATVAAVGIPIPAGPGGTNGRVDIIEVRYNRVLGEPTSRDVLNPITGVFAPNTVNKNLAWTLGDTYAIVGPSDVSATSPVKYKTGVVGAAGAPPGDPTGLAVPVTTPGYIKIAEVFVYSNTTVFDIGMIKDTRPYILNNGLISVGAQVTYTNNGGVLKSTVNQVTGPAGTRATANFTGTNTGTLLFIVGGAFPYFGTNLSETGVVTMSFGGSPPTPASGVVALYAVPPRVNATIMTAALAAVLNDPTQTAPTILVAVGQPVISVTTHFLNGSAAGVSLAPGQEVEISYNLLLQRKG